MRTVGQVVATGGLAVCVYEVPQAGASVVLFVVGAFAMFVGAAIMADTMTIDRQEQLAERRARREDQRRRGER